jgi:hypothetical protein
MTLDNSEVILSGERVIHAITWHIFGRRPRARHMTSDNSEVVLSKRGAYCTCVFTV